VSDSSVSSCKVRSFAITRFFRIEGKPGICSRISSPLWSKHAIVDIMSAARSGCVSPMNIRMGRDSGLVPKTCCEGFFIKGCSKNFFDTAEGVERFRFKNMGRGSGEIKPICLSSAVSFILHHSNMVICEGTDEYQIW